MARRTQRELRPHRQQRAATNALRDVLHPIDLLQLGNEIQRILGQRRTQQQHARLARDAAPDHHPPWRATLVGVAQGQQRQAQFDAVAIDFAVHGRFELEVGGEVFVVGVRDVHAVCNDPGGIDPNELRRAARAHRIQEYRDEVLVAPHLVAPRERSADVFGVRVIGSNAEHDGLRFQYHPHRGAIGGGRRLPVEREVLNKGVVHGRPLPNWFLQSAVDAQWAFVRREGYRTRTRAIGIWRGRLGRCAERHSRQRQGRQPAPADALTQ